MRLFMCTIAAFGLTAVAAVARTPSVTETVAGQAFIGCEQQAIEQGKYSPSSQTPVVDKCMSDMRFKLKPECEGKDRDGSCYSRSIIPGG